MNLAIRVRNGGLLPALSDHPSLASALNTIKCYPPSCNLSINVPTVMLLSHALASYALASLLSHVPSVAAFPTFSLLSGVVLCHLHLQFTVSCAHSPPLFLVLCRPATPGKCMALLWASLLPFLGCIQGCIPPKPGKALCQRRTLN